MPEALFSAIAVVVFAALAVLVYVARGRTLARQRASIDEAFLAHAAVSVDPRLRLEPRAAVLLQEHEECREADAVQVHRVYRSQVGEYFLFICKSGEKGYLQHLTREQAKHALRSNPSVFRREFPDSQASARARNAP